MFESALTALGLTKKALKSRSEFNFDSGDAANLEGAIAILRVVAALREWNFRKIKLIQPASNKPCADLVSEKNGQKVCWEVKAVTKQSSGRSKEGLLFIDGLEDQLYEKILESISKARTQLEASAAHLHCTVKIFVCVVNWFDHSIYLDQDNYQHIVNRLEKDQDLESLQGVDGVLFVLKPGHTYFFLKGRGKSIDCR